MPLPSLSQLVEQMTRPQVDGDPLPIEGGTVIRVSGDVLEVEADSGGVFIATQAGDEPFKINDRVSASKNRLGQTPALLVHGFL